MYYLQIYQQYLFLFFVLLIHNTSLLLCMLLSFLLSSFVSFSLFSRCFSRSFSLSFSFSFYPFFLLFPSPSPSIFISLHLVSLYRPSFQNSISCVLFICYLPGLQERASLKDIVEHKWLTGAKGQPVRE